MCCYNVPGSQEYDSKIAWMGGLYEKLKAVYEESGGCCALSSIVLTAHFVLMK